MCAMRALNPQDEILGADAPVFLSREDPAGDILCLVGEPSVIKQAAAVVRYARRTGPKIGGVISIL
jgi:hypothetical protein